VSFVQSVANVLASAVERIRAQERVGEVREIERRRIARDLHDEALQELTDAIVQADPGRAAGLDSEAAERLVSTLKRVGRQLRGAIYDLRLAEEQSRPFPEALGALVEVHRAMAVDCEIGLDVTGESVTRLRGRRATEVLRIVGEALTNARRHSGARRVRVSVHGSGGTMSVEVTDDGRGFAARARAGSDGTGTRGMRERAALLGGDLDIRSRPGAGTSLRLELEPAADEARTATAARILLVEDHTAVREAIAAMLAQEPDLDVVAQAGSLAEARGMLHDVDVAVLDLGLPDGYGTELVTELRDANPHAQALVLSASLDPAEIARATDSGAAAMLDKTAQLDELVQTVRRLHHSAALSS
jgi:CheY-like chemotaxis protein